VPVLFGPGRSQRCRWAGHWQATRATPAMFVRVGLHPDPNPVTAGHLASCNGVLRRHDPRHRWRVAWVLVDGEQLRVQRDVMRLHGGEADQCGDDGRFSALFSLSHTPRYRGSGSCHLDR
jgi:hypothetical protein